MNNDTRFKNRIVTLITVLIAVFALAGCEKKDRTDYVAKGYEQLGVPNYVEAMSSFETAINNGSDLTKAYRGLGICHMYFGEYEYAIDDFTNALHSSGAYPKDIDFDINYYMGICYHKTGDYQAAKERYGGLSRSFQLHLPPSLR